MICILHIGTEKTATTSFQNYFWSHGDKALDYGLWYPRSLGTQWHRNLAVYAMDPSRPDDAFRSIGIENKADHRKFCRKLEAGFAAEYSTFNKHAYCLISSEHFHSRLRSEAEIKRIKTFLEPHFSKFMVVVHLRPQIDLLISLASTVARGAEIVGQEFFNPRRMRNHNFNYDGLLRLWEGIFGFQNVRVVPFVRQADLRKVLVELTGLPLDGFGTLKRLNTALDIEMIAMLNVIKQHGLDAARIGAIINGLPVREKILLNRDLAISLQQRCAEGNRRLTDRYSTIKQTDLELDVMEFPEVGNLHRLAGTCDFPNALSDFFEQASRLKSSNQKLRQRLRDLSN